MNSVSRFSGFSVMDAAPLRFVPVLKSVIWGGDKICKLKGIPQPVPDVGESWEVSALPGAESLVADGPYKGLSLPDLIDRFGPQLLGDFVFDKYGACFPLLVKLIDAHRDLSVQVHPDDVMAMSRHGCRGKTEMWYLIQTDPGARIFSGLKVNMSPDDYEIRVKEGSFADAVASYAAAPDDLFFIPAGRVHAIGAGNLLVEIQESSDITYRIFDYGRRDADGNLRPLHTAEARDAIDFSVLPDYRSPRIPLGEGVVPLVCCDCFCSRRIVVRHSLPVSLSGDSFSVLVCVDGCASLCYPGGETLLKAGETVLLPAVIPHLSVAGHATLIISDCR